jgi:glyoxylase-like metal-dependent hydrolase (beta-lactamase superfamily II)
LIDDERQQRFAAVIFQTKNMQRFKTIKIIKAFSFVAIFTMYAFNSYAQQTAPAQLDQAYYHRMKLGDNEIMALSDGTITIDLHKLLENINPAKIDQLSASSYQTSNEEASVNAYLLKLGGKNILIDAGTGELYGPTLGHLPERLRKIGVPPEAIDIILITHIHTDHTGGLMDGTKMVFPNATLYISKPEVDFWLGEESERKADKRLAHWFKEARDKVGPYLKAGKVKNFVYGKELFPGITPVAAPGHTPGHTFYAVESKGEKMLFVGDMVHASAIQFPVPTVTINFDVDPGAAAKSRIATFGDASEKGYWLAADHIAFPGIGHVIKEGQGFRWIPINYSTLGTGQ